MRKGLWAALPVALGLAAFLLWQRAPLPNLSPEACLDGADLLLVATAHSAFAELDPADAAARMRGRRVYDAHRLLPAGRWVDAGFTVEVLGVG